MHAVSRTQVFNRTCSLIRGGCYNNNNVQCICVVNNRIPYDFKESRRLLSISNPGVVTIFSSNSLKYNLYNNNNNNGNSLNLIRNFSLSPIYNEASPKPSSKVEATVQELKNKETQPAEVVPKVVQKTIGQKIRDEIVHYYHGFRLLFIDVKISTNLVFRVLTGHTLTRREYRLLIRTVGDMFRLVPFSVFIIVPFMEILLPFFIKFFPGMLPSTFQTASEKESKMKQSLKVKLDMAKFLQETLDDMAVQHTERKSDRAKEFSEWFHKVRTSGELVSTDEIMKFSKLFEDEITLDSLSRSQLIALCRVLEIQTLGTNNFLRFQLRMKLRSLAADDRMIEKEGVDALTLGELQHACRARGMRAYGVSEDRLKIQLKQWLDLSLHQKVPPSLLLLSRALMLPETIPTSDKLKATISALPETIVTQTKAAIGEKEGKIDNKIKIEVLREEEKKIKEERREQKEEKKKLELAKEKEKAKEILIDKAPIISASSTPILEDTAAKISAEKLEKVEQKDTSLEKKDFEIIEHAIDEVSKKQNLIVEKEELNEIKEQLADYKEDVEDLQKAVATQPKPEIKESKAAQRLFKSVNKMINKLDTVVNDLEKKEEQLKEKIQREPEVDGVKEELLKIDDILSVIKHIKGDDAKTTEKIMNILKKMDDDSDGSIKVEDILKVIEIIGKENVNLTDKQVDELIDLLNKEQVLEVETKIEKALQKDKELQEDTKKAALTKASSESTTQTINDSNKKLSEQKNDGPLQTQLSDQQPIIPPPPPVDSIDKSKTKEDSTKM